MAATSTVIIKVVLLNVLVLSAVASGLADDDKDQIVDPEDFAHFALPPSRNSSLFQGNEWETWEASEDVKTNFPYVRSGYDEDGLVVHIVYFGKYRYRDLFPKSQEKIDELEKHTEQFFLRATADAVKNGNKGIVLIVDFDGFSMRNIASAKVFQFGLKLFMLLGQLNDACKYGFIINVNFAAETVLYIAKPFLGDLLTKLEIDGTKAAKWKPKILRKIAASQLPPALGGSEGWTPLPLPKHF